MPERIGIFEQYPPATWKVAGKELTFAIERLEERRSNRLIEHKRIYRDGARLDDTGAEARRWVATCRFFNDQDQEAGIDGAGQYPDNLNELCDSFDEHETGELVLPTRGPRRCRAESYTRIEDNAERDQAVVTFIWLEDNEDDAATAAASIPSAKSQNINIIASADFALAKGSGIPTGNLNDLASDLQGLAEAPGEFVSQFENRVNALGSKLVETERAFTKATAEAKTEAESLLTDPENSRALKLVRRARDNTAKIVDEVVQSLGPPIVSVTFPNPLSLWDVAAKLGQDPLELAKLNASLDDLLEILPGTPVRVFDDAASR